FKAIDEEIRKNLNLSYRSIRLSPKTIDKIQSQIKKIEKKQEMYADSASEFKLIGKEEKGRIYSELSEGYDDLATILSHLQVAFSENDLTEEIEQLYGTQKERFSAIDERIGKLLTQTYPDRTTFEECKPNKQCDIAVWIYRNDKELRLTTSQQNPKYVI